MTAKNRSTASRTVASQLIRYGAPAIALILIIALFVSYKSYSRDSCSSELLVAGEKLDFQAAFDKLKLKGAASPAAQEKITQQLQFYIESSARLCRQLKAGQITSAEYLQRIDVASAWYMNVQQLAANGKLRDVTPDSSAALAVAPTVTSSAAPQLLATLKLTTSDDAILPDGATIRAGDRIALTVTVPKPSFVYVLNLGSSGSLGRAFPVSSASDLPVSGTIRIPADPAKFLKIGGPPGLEKLMVFVSDEPDPELEKVAVLTTNAKADAARSAQQIAVVRDLFTESELPRAPAARPIPVELRSRFGKAAITITLRNAG